MAVEVGGRDIAYQALETEYRVLVLENIMNLLVQKTGVAISDGELKKIRNDAVTSLNQKYPNSGIKLKEQ